MFEEKLKAAIDAGKAAAAEVGSGYIEALVDRPIPGFEMRGARRVPCLFCVSTPTEVMVSHVLEKVADDDALIGAVSDLSVATVIVDPYSACAEAEE